MGIFLISLSALISVGKDMFSTRLAGTLSGRASAFASFLFPLPLYVPLLVFLYVTGLDDLTFTSALLLATALRALADAGAETCKMAAFRFHDLSTVSVVGAFSGVLVMFLAPIIAGDPLSPETIAAVIVSTVGTAVVVYKPMRNASVQSVGLAIGLVVCMALNSCFDRLSSTSGSAPLAAFLMTAMSAVILFPVALGTNELKVTLHSVRRDLWFRAALEVAFMTIKLIAFKYLTAPEAVVLSRISLPISALAGRHFFKEEDFGRKLIGITLILAGFVIVAVSKI